jgi:hypothetical protein
MPDDIGNINFTLRARALNEDAVDALERAVRSRLLPMVLGDMPVGDPRLDPDPAIAMRAETKVFRDRNTVRIVVNTEYAAVQHWSLNQHPRGGKARFLEDNLKIFAPMMEQIAGEAIRRRLEHGF